MPSLGSSRVSLGPLNVSPGQVVQYCGRIRGGPRFGVKGTVVEIRLRQAVVDLGQSGRWHIPYYMLMLPAAA